jgi:orotate phosphoribosyltransferase
MHGNTTAEAQLLDLLVERSYQRRAKPSFRLSSGKWSNFYVNCKATTMCGDAMPLVGEVFASYLLPDTCAVGGLTMGADWIASAIAFYCRLHGHRIDAFSVRKQPKKHGMQKWIEGSVATGARVIVVEDVVTTGASTIDAIERCREEGLQVAAVVALVDRQEEDGMEAIRRVTGRAVPVYAIFTNLDLDARLDARKRARRRVTRGTTAGPPRRPGGSR